MKAPIRDSLKNFVRRRMPPGTRITPDAVLYVTLMSASVIRSLFFLIDYFNARSALFRETLSGEQVLRDGAMMPALSSLMPGVLAGFTFTAAAMLVYVFRNLFSFYQGSRSIYLMRRLPDLWELPRRTVVLPLYGIAAALLFSLLMYGILYAVYMGVTPPSCLPPTAGGIPLTAFFGF